MTGASLTIEEYSEFDQIHAYVDAWNSLVDREGYGPALRPDWLQSVWMEKGTGKRLVIKVIRSGDQCVGFAPFVFHRENRKGVPVRIVQPLSMLNQLHGTQMVVASDFREAVVGSVLRSLGQPKQHWDLLLMYLSASDIQTRCLLDHFRSAHLRYVVQPGMSPPFMNVTGTWDELMAGLQSRFRSTLRSRERRLREKARVELRYHDSPDDTAQGLRAIEEIESRSWKHDTGLPITDPSHWGFYQRYAQRAAQASMLRLPILYLNDEPVAYDYGLIHQGVYYLLQTSYKDEWKADFPGFVLRKLLIEDLTRVGIRQINFGGDATEWKMKWTNQKQRYDSYLVFGRSVRGLYLRKTYSFGEEARAGVHSSAVGASPGIEGDIDE